MNRILLTLGLLVCLLQPASGQFRLSGRAIALESGEMLAGVWVNLLTITASTYNAKTLNEITHNVQRP